jgi:hypothetical protein
MGSPRKDFAEGRLVELEPHRNRKTVQNVTSPWRSYMTVGGIPTIRMTLQNGLKHNYGHKYRHWTVETML